MKKIYEILIFAFIISMTFGQTTNAQNCTTALQPISVTATQGAPSGIAPTPPGVLTPSSSITVTWDPQCGIRAGDGCEYGDGNSLGWYVGIYGQNSPAPNGVAMECGSSFQSNFDCASGNKESLVLINGGDYNGLCLAPKGSTCISSEFSQMRPPAGGDITSWHTFGADPSGFLGACDDAGGGVLPLETTLPICPGQCYNVVVWEFVINAPSGSGPNSDNGNGGYGTQFPFAGFDNNLACGNITLLSESPPSEVIEVCIDAADGTDNALIDIPTLTVSNSVNGDATESVCDALDNQAYTGTYQAQPEDVGDATGNTGDPCNASNVDANVIDALNNGSDPLLSDGTVDQTTGGTGNGGNAGDLLVTFGGAGAPSANGQLGLGAHVVEVNCREDIGIVFSTPEGCDGYTDQTVFGDPACSSADGSLLATSAKVYIYNNGIPLPSAGNPDAYPTCYVGTTTGTGTCTSNNGSGYPNNYQAQFGNFGSTEDDPNDPNFEGDCILNLVGNPFEGSGTNPFTLPGALSGIDFGDGVARDVSNICVAYEDPCDGSKSMTCVKFISDAPPLDALTASCSETCLGDNDGKLYVYDIVGGSADPNSDALYADGNGGGYVVEVTAGPSNVGSTLVNIGGSTWELTGMTPGVYTVEIRDNLAPADLLNVEGDEGTAMCGAACPIERIIAVLPGPEVPVIPTVVPPSCTTDGTANIKVDRSTIEFVMQDTQTDTQPSFGASGPLGDDLGFGAGVPFDMYTTTTLSAIVNLPYAGCNPVPTVDGFTAGDICFSLDGCGDAGDAYFLSPDGSFINVDFGAAIGGGLTGSETVCLPISGNFPGETINGTWTMFYLDYGQNLNNNGFGGTAADCEVTFRVTFNDLTCIDETDLTAFCGAAGPDEGDGTGAISSADQTLTWTSAGPDTGTEAGFDFITLSGAGENDATFSNQAALDAGIAPGTDVCYDIAGFVPGNNFLSGALFTDVQGTSPDCYIGACCPISEQVCFTVVALPDPPAAFPVCTCDSEPATNFTASGLCPATQEFESGNTNTSIGQFESPAFGPGGGVVGEVYEFSPTIPAGCSISNLSVTVTGAAGLNVEIVDFGGGNAALGEDGNIFGGPLTYTFPSIPGSAMSAAPIINVYVYDDFGAPATITDVIYSFTYDCPPATPMYTWYGGTDTMTVVGATAAVGDYTPADGDVDINGNAFTSGACGNFTFCATIDCAGCEGPAFCTDYTVNPSAGGNDVDLTVCEGDDTTFDLAGANNGGLDFDIYSDPGLMTLVTSVTDGMFNSGDTAPGIYMYFYASPATCNFMGFVENTNCSCDDPGSITLTIDAAPAPGTCEGKEACAGNLNGTDITLTATCPTCPDMANPLPCGTDPCNLPDASCGVVVTNTVVIMGSAPFSIEYEGDGANYSETLMIEIPAGTAEECCNVIFDYSVDYMITPFGGSWTSEVSFDIVGPSGVIVANTGAGLPGSGNNNTPIDGNIAGSSASTVGGFTGGVTMNVQDNFNDGGVDGTFAGMVTYTLTVEVCEVQNATYDGPPIPGSAASVEWCTIDGTDTTLISTNSILDPSVDDAAFDVNTPGLYSYYFSCACGDCATEKTVCTLEIFEQPVVSLATPLLGCNDVVEDLNLSPVPPPNDPSGTGVYSGTGAQFVDASGTMIVPNYQMVMSQGVPYSLTYTFTSNDGCSDSQTITILFEKNCDADAGRFDEDE